MANDPKNLIFGGYGFKFNTVIPPANPEKASSYTIDFGNIIEGSLKPESEKKEHFGSYKGVKKRDRVRRVKKKLTGTFKLDELSPAVLAYFFGGASGAAPDFAKSYDGFGWIGIEQEDEPINAAGNGILVWHSFKCTISFEGELKLNSEDNAEIELTVEVDLGTPGIYVTTARPITP